MKKPFFRRCFNRVLHFVARYGPGATSLRPFLHRLRGVQIGKRVFIADEVYLENEYPEAVEIQDGVQISVRAIIIAHTRGPGRVVIEKDAYVGPNTVIASAGGRTLRIGEGAVIGAGVVVSAAFVLLAGAALREPAARERLVPEDASGHLRRVAIHYVPALDSRALPVWRQLFRALPSDVVVEVAVAAHPGSPARPATEAEMTAKIDDCLALYRRQAGRGPSLSAFRADLRARTGLEMVDA